MGNPNKPVLTTNHLTVFRNFPLIVMSDLTLYGRLIQINPNPRPQITLHTPIPIDMYASIEVSLRCSVIEANLSIQHNALKNGPHRPLPRDNPRHRRPS